MEEARADFPDRVVRASDPRAPRYATCDHCGGDVVLRRGTLVRRHYAHLKGEGADDCDAYFISRTGNNGHSISRPKVQIRAIDDSFYRSGGLYVALTSAGQPELLLKLPIPTEMSDWEGKFVVSTPEGEQSLSFRQVRQSKFLRLRIQRQLFSYRVDGRISESYLARLTSNNFQLNDVGNIFKWSAHAGRLLSTADQVYWGERYWALLREDRPERLLNSVQSVTERQFVLGDGWALLEIQLPTDSNVLGMDAARSLTKLFGHEIHQPSPRLILWSPQPHHIDQDSVYVLPSECGEITLRRSEELWVDAYTESGEALNIFEHEDEFVSIAGLKEGLTTVYFDGRVAFELVKERCGLFNPISVGFNVNGRIRDIFEIDSLKEVVLDAKQIQFVVGSEMLLQIIKLNGTSIQSSIDVDQAFADRDKPFFLDAGNFGHLNIYPVTSKAVSFAEKTELETYAKFVLSLADGKGSLVFRSESLVKDMVCSPIVHRLMMARWSPAHVPHLNRLKQLFERREDFDA